MLSHLQNLITELNQDCSLDEPAQLCQRIEALDRLELYALDSQARLDGAGSSSEADLYGQVRAIYARLEAVNRELYHSIRCEIQRGARPVRLLQWAPQPGRNGRAASQMSGEGYDYLDVLISGVLQLEQPDAEVAEPGPEMMFYQPTPARHIFDLLGRAALTKRDVLVDLGSGLGHIALLAAICTDASGIGIELEPAFIRCARRSARDLKLANVTFIQQDARAADFSSGTLFYLYTPFRGTILRQVLASLRQEAARREIRVCTYGPCTATVAEERWLEAVGPLQAERIALFRCRS